MEDELKKRLDPGYPKTGNRRRKRTFVSRDIDRRMTESEKKNYIKRNNPRKKMPTNDPKKLPTRSILVSEFSHGGEAKVRGMGAAIKGGKFEGVF